MEDTLYTESRNGYTVKVTHEDWADDPTNWGTFKIHEMSNDFLTENDKLLPSVQAKLKAGKMFLVDKYEHGNTVLRLAGEQRDRWDTSPNWGIIEFENEYIKGIDFNERRRYAKQDLAMYTDWLNGEVYRVDITEDATGEYIDGGGDCYGLEEAIANAKANFEHIVPVHSAAGAKKAQELHR